MLFFLKTRNRKARPKDRAYANVLRLAEDVQNYYNSREPLMDLIKQAINDEKLTPSDLHIKLLSLPWHDVYTTNYDTLLERSSDILKQQGNNSYTTILNGQDLGRASSPILMKLHGDINDESSIIITEEDYRTYPAKHPAMVSYIQNAIMMRTLVLIGFSGNDPNFIQWLGWVKDALGSSQRKVYLLSVDAISDATRTTFEKKNVIVVDLRGLAGKKAEPSENLETAIDYLEKYPTKREQEKTKFRNWAVNWGRLSINDMGVSSNFELWKKDRDTYPGWLVLPRDRREYWAESEGFSLSKKELSQLSGDNALLYLDLFNWRIERCLYPIENSWEETYLSVLAKYKPFSRHCRIEIREAWINLKLGLLRLYRQEGWYEKWNSLRDELFPLKGRMIDDQRCRFEYEQALEAVYRNDFDWLKEVLDNWKEAKSDIYWDIRRGALWAEYLSLDKGREITKIAFNGICEKLENSTDERERFYWGSRKVNAHTVWECMVQANFSDGSSELDAARKTWLDLRQYEDIWYEREFFETHLRPIEDTLVVKTKTPSFRLGHSSITTNMGGNSKYVRVAYAFFLFYEEVGFPVHLPFLNTIDKSSLQKALSVMEYCSPAIAECWLLRSGDSKVVPSIYNRRFLERTSCELVDTLYRRYLDSLDCLLKAECEKEELPWTLSFRSVLPEILSRLTMKASYEARLKTLDYVDAVFSSKYITRYEGLDNMIQMLMLSFSKNETSGLIPRLAGMSIASGRYGDFRMEPLFFVNKPKTYGVKLTAIADGLFHSIGKNKNEEKAILFRLMTLCQLEALSEEQRDRLANILWSKLDTNGFPDRTIYSRFAFLSFPHPEGVDPQELLKKYFLTQSPPAVGNGTPISFYGGITPYFNDLRGTTNSDISFSWDETLLNNVCDKLLSMWETGKERLLEDEIGWSFSVKDEMRNRFDDLETVVTSVIAPHFEMLNEDNKTRLARMISEYEAYGMPSLRMKNAIGTEVDVDHEIQTRICSPDERAIDDCISAIIHLHRKGVDVNKYVVLMSDYFRCNAERGRDKIIRGLNYFIDYDIIKSNDTIKKNLILGLKRLFKDTEIDTKDEEQTVNDKMFLRMSVAHIVKGLSGVTIPEDKEVISSWQDYYNSDDTCWDIRNHYLDLE